MTDRILEHELAEDSFLALIDAAVGEILVHEDPDRFLEWVRRVVPERFASVFPMSDEDLLRMMAVQFGIAIWNAVPLPGRGFRPRPLPKPEPNAPCLCGSGRSFKDCCALLLPIPAIDPQGIWSLLVARLDKATLANAVAAKSLPAHLMAELADRELAEGHPKKAVRLLAPLFAERLDQLDGRYEHALNLLCDVYDALGWQDKKLGLLERVAREAGAEDRADAWQRLCTWHIDRRQFVEAWSAFREAQRCNAKDPSLAMLEITLLLTEEKSSQASERAQVWLKQLARDGITDGGLVDFLRQAVSSPSDALAETFFDAMAPGANELKAWLADVIGRPVPSYTLEVIKPLDLDNAEAARKALRDQLMGMGLPSKEVDRQVDNLLDQLREQIVTETAERQDDQSVMANEFMLCPPAELAKLEAAWHEVYPTGKPFSIQFEVVDNAAAWEPEVIIAWLGLLKVHPEGFDSLDILDDLATAVAGLGTSGVVWVDEAAERPILDRAVAIIEKALGEQAAVQLPWAITENRPALRLLARDAYYWHYRNDAERTGRAMDRLLTLNPEDNHGLRGLRLNALLRAGDDQGALELATCYPEDASPELAYGRVLALYRLGRREAAREALQNAVAMLPQVLKFLTGERVRKPKLDPSAITFGGKDEAWYYREAMRDVWVAAPGLLDWLKRAASK